jgi:hypothetical protein
MRCLMRVSYGGTYGSDGFWGFWGWELMDLMFIHFTSLFLGSSIELHIELIDLLET